MTVIAHANPERKTPATPDSGRIGLEAERRLRRAAYLALRDVRCVPGEGMTLLLRGRLPSHYLRQVAQALVADIEGVGQVINEIAVAAAGGRTAIGRDDAPWGSKGINF